MKTIALLTVIALTSCATVITTRTDSKGAIVTTRTTSPAQGVVEAIGVAVGGALDAALQSLTANSN